MTRIGPRWPSRRRIRERTSLHLPRILFVGLQGQRESQPADHPYPRRPKPADANGAYTRAQARRVGPQLDELGVLWFEEPVNSDDLDDLAVARRAELRCRGW